MNTRKNGYTLFYSFYSFAIIALYYYLSSEYGFELWITPTALICVSNLLLGIFCLIKKGLKLLSLPVVFLIFMFVFNCGQVVLLGIFKNYEFYKSWNKLQIYPESTYEKTILFYLLVTVFYTFGCLCSRAKYKKIKASSDSQYQPNFNSLGKTVLLITLPFNLYENISYLRASITYGYHEIYRLNMPDFVTALGWISVVGFVLQICDKPNNRKPLIISMCIYGMEMLSGNRGSAMVAIITVILFYFMINQNISFSVKRIIIWGVLIFVCLIFLSAIKTYRGFQGKTIENLWICIIDSLNRNVIFENLEEFGGTVAVPSIAQEYVNSGGTFLYGRTYFVGLFSIFINIGFLNFTKITNSGSIVYLLGQHGIYGIYQTIGSSLVAELYLNFGAFLFVPAFFIGLILTKIDYAARNSCANINIAYYVMPFFGIIHWVRWNYNSMVRIIVWSWILMYCLTTMYNWHNKKPDKEVE